MTPLEAPVKFNDLFIGECIGVTKTTVGDIIGLKNSEIDVTLQGKKGKETGKLHVKIDKQSEPDQFVLW